MTDIFISYATDDRPIARRLADALEAEGRDIWWDREIPAGVTFETFIEQRLGEAACAVVIWSQHSVDSMWVRAEANEAMAQGKLVPVVIDDAQPPLVFRQIQTADLRGWEGDRDDPRFRKLVGDVGAVIARRAAADARAATEAPVDTGERPRDAGGGAPPAEPGATVADTGSGGRPRRWPWIVAAFIALLAGIGGTWFYLQTPGPPAITRFEALPNSVTGGDQSKLVWETRGAEVVTLHPGRNVDARGSMPVRPDKTTRYTLTARNPGGKTTQSVQVTVHEPKPKAAILAFEAERASIQYGEKTRLRWKTQNAVRVELDERQVDASGSLTVSPSQTTVYRLTVTGESGKRSGEKVKVAVAAPSKAQILSFEATSTKVEQGQTTTLSWRTRDAARVELNGKPMKPSGSMRMRPSKSTDYRLTATGRAGDATDRVVRVRVSAPAQPKRHWLVLSGGGKPLSDKRVRQALAMAVGWQSILDRLMKGKDVVPALDVPIGSGRTSVAGERHDMSAAKRLLAEAGYPDGFQAYLYVTSERMKDFGEPVSAYLNRIGIKVRLGVIARNAALSRARSSHEKNAPRSVLFLDLERH